MKLLFNLLKSSFTDKLAYISAVVGALCWVLHARYPALFPGSLKASAHIYATLLASMAGGMLIAKYVFIEGYLRSTREIEAEKEAFAGSIQRLEEEIREIREERDRISGCESVLRNRLTSLENGETVSQLSSLRKKIRSHEEDEKTVLAFLLHELRGHLHDLDGVDDREIVRAAMVLKREIQLLEDEAKKGGRSLYELVLKMNEIRENIWDLTLIRLQAVDGQEESAIGQRKPNEFRWVDSETDPSRLERIYKFLKVAFHPDRFSSAELKEEATAHFQEVVKAYTTLKERIRTTH
ncbi:MAG TPA: J domain-containing protein [Geobacteraceae bacterium]|nr:J domain-containing protein [Geobacteraceae bacterium]